MDKTKWTLRSGAAERRASDLSEIQRWYREGKITDLDSVFNPVDQEWYNKGDFLKKMISSVLVTTTGNIEGKRICRYIDVESIEVVLGTGLFGEIATETSDVFSIQTKMMEGKLREAKRNALDSFRLRAFKRDGNAIVGLAMDYEFLPGNNIVLVLIGTIVQID